MKCDWLYLGFDVLRTGAIMPCSQYHSYKNTLCQDKQWPEIWWIFLGRDNEVWLTPIKLNWASAPGLFQRQWEGLAENQKPLYLQKGGKRRTLLKRAWRDLRVPTSTENKAEKSAATRRVYELGWSFTSLLHHSSYTSSQRQLLVMLKLLIQLSKYLGRNSITPRWSENN